MTADYVTVAVRLDTAELERQLAALRLLCSQIGFACDNVLVSLREASPNDGSGATP